METEQEGVTAYHSSFLLIGHLSNMAAREEWMQYLNELLVGPTLQEHI